ncbi:cold shock domain-containing protein [Providencia rustigianii]
MTRLNVRFRFDTVHQGANRQHRIFFINTGICGYIFIINTEGFYRSQFNALACNINIFAFRYDFNGIGRQTFGIGSRFESHRRIFLDQIRIGDLNHMKITVIPIFIFDKAKTFLFKPRCDYSVHRYYRLLNIYSVFTARSIKHNACTDHAFGLSLDDNFLVRE